MDSRVRALARPSLAEPVTRMVTAVRERFVIDTRALAVLRMSLGFIILVDLIHRSGSIAMFYTDAGAHPIAAYEASFSRFTGLSLHAVSGDLWFQQVLFVVAGLFALSLMVGYRTRFVAVISLLLLFSLQARNPAVLNGADRLLRVLLLLAILTPMGERWSIDALRRGSARTRVVGFTTAALLVQPLAVFGANAIEKYRGDTWFQGEALELALASDVMTILLGNHLLVLPSPMLALMNWFWVLLLTGAVVFLLGTTGTARALAALVYIAAFMGMLLTLSVGLFPLVLTAAVIPYLTTPFWETLERHTPLDRWQTELSRDDLGWFSPPPLETRYRDVVGSRWTNAIGTICTVILSILGLLALIWILLFTAATVTAYEVPEPIDHEHLDEQRWSLYAPDPGQGYSWQVVEATYESGATAEPLANGEVSAEHPPDAAAVYDSFRERKFAERVRTSAEDNPGWLSIGYAEWLCGQAEETREDDQVTSVTIYQVVQRIPADGEYDDPEPRTVLSYDC